MNARWMKAGVALTGAVALLAIATPAFASSLASSPEGPGAGQEPSTNLTLTVAATTVNGVPEYQFNVTGIDTTTSNSELYFRVLTETQFNAFAQPTPSQTQPGPNSVQDDMGTIIPAEDFSTSTSGQNLPATMTFDIPQSDISAEALDLPAAPYAITVAQYSMDRTNELAGEGISPIDPFQPGQLPEVPFAVGVPLVGLAAGALVWRRRQRLGTRA